MNLPAAIFAEAQHLKSDLNTKMGLPVPALEVFSPEFASNLYRNNYDALCLKRDSKIIGVSGAISILIDTIIAQVHNIFYNPQKDGIRELFEVRTRKILLISNAIGSSSNILATYFSKNIKSLDIGGLLLTLSHLFRDTRFVFRIKKEFLENNIYQKIEKEIEELDKLEEELINYGYEHKSIYDK